MSVTSIAVYLCAASVLAIIDCVLHDLLFCDMPHIKPCVIGLIMIIVPNTMFHDG